MKTSPGPLQVGFRVRIPVKLVINVCNYSATKYNCLFGAKRKVKCYTVIYECMKTVKNNERNL